MAIRKIDAGEVNMSEESAKIRREELERKGFIFGNTFVKINTTAKADAEFIRRSQCKEKQVERGE